MGQTKEVLRSNTGRTVRAIRLRDNRPCRGIDARRSMRRGTASSALRVRSLLSRS